MWITRNAPPTSAPTLEAVEWDRLFEDLEDQLASGWEAERAALNAESERLRIARLDLRTRAHTLSAEGAAVALTLADASTVAGRLRAVGADWLALEPSAGHTLILMPLASITLWAMDHPTLLASSAPSDGLSAVRERMSLGFVLRDLARRRVRVTIRIRGGQELSGTVDRAGADHLDLALHDLNEPRRAQAVRGFRIVPFDALLSVHAERVALGGVLG